MAKTAMIRARIRPDLKEAAEKILHKIGMSTSEAINIFFSQVMLNKGLPFDVRIPNKTTLKAMKDAAEGKNLNTYDSVEDFKKKMRSKC